jgi:peptide/nickel transport system substrate-binding protein
MGSREISRRELLKRSGLATIGILGGPSLLAACTSAPSVTPNNTPGGSTDEQPVRGGIYSEPFGNVLGINPISNTGSLDLKVQYFFFTGLLAPGIDGQPFPDLATAMPTLSPDKKSYTFTLNKDAKWSDGKPLTADDVVFTYQVHTLPQYSAVRSAYRSELNGIMADIKATDAYTVVITLKEPSSSFLTNMGTHRVVPKHILGSLTPAQFNDSTFGKSPGATCGPFNFKSYSVDSIVGVRNDTYFRGAPYLDGFVAPLDVPSEANMLKNGEVTAAISNAFATYAELAAHPDLVFTTFDAPGPHFYFNFDPSRPTYKIFSSKVVRQALLYAADRPGTVVALGGHGSVHKSSGAYPPYSYFDNPNSKPEYTYDPKRAEEMLDREGWRKGPNGIRQKDGVPMRFEVLKPANLSWEEVAQVFQENWKAIGVDMQVKRVPYAQMTADTLINHNFDATISLNTSFFSADPDLSLRLHSRNAVPGGSNWGMYKNPELDKLLEEGAVEPDREKRKAIYFKVQDLLNEELPSFSPQFWKRSWTHNKRLKGMEVGKQIGVYGYNGSFINKAWLTAP